VFASQRSPTDLAGRVAQKKTSCRLTVDYSRLVISVKIAKALDLAGPMQRRLLAQSRHEAGNFLPGGGASCPAAGLDLPSKYLE
jgi:hypothetical protein